MEDNELNNHESEEFFPKGAIAFFLVLMVIFMAIWFAMYFELLSRG